MLTWQKRDVTRRCALDRVDFRAIEICQSACRKHLGRRAFREERAAREKRHTISMAERMVRIMRGKEHREAPRFQGKRPVSFLTGSD